MKFNYRHIEADGYEISRLDYNAHVVPGPLPAFTGAIEVPASVHPHVCEQDQVTGKADQVPLACRGDRFYCPARKGPVFIHAREFGQDRFESRDSLTRERLIHRASGAKDGVSFGHCGSGWLLVWSGC